MVRLTWLRARVSCYLKLLLTTRHSDMWHCITVGEADEDIDLVFKDAIAWVLARI